MQIPINRFTIPSWNSSDGGSLNHFFCKALSLLIVCAYGLPVAADGIKFEWKLKPKSVLEVNEYHNIVFRMGRDKKGKEDKNRIVLKVSQCAKDACELSGVFDTYSRLRGNSKPFYKENTFYSNFTLKKDGEYIVPDEYIMPNLRSTPSFPESEIRPGDKWQKKGLETFDFGSDKLKVPFMANYELEGTSDWEYAGRTGKAEKITYSYDIFYSAKALRNVPFKIFGFAKAIIFFDPMKGIPQYKRNKLHYTFVYPNGIVQEADYDIHALYDIHDILDDDSKDRMASEISRGLNDAGTGKDPDKMTPKVEVAKTKDGITMSLDSVLFDLNESTLKKEAVESLEKIAGVLEKYKNREVRIGGHTDNTGSPVYNQRLSEERALTVLNRLKDQYGIDQKRLSYQGYGEKHPRVSNETEEGRKKNRRVDITIMTE